ncbi:penicillin-binding protein 2 [Candidatus Wolfebacteria bacterium]|nr:penicillin-binding protein 2 [Candidatus Wolfebacteria bacterium]
MKWRHWLIISIFGISYFVLIFNLYDIQFKKGSFYAAKARLQNQASGVLEAKRGIIYFTDKNNSLIPVVVNKEYPVIFSVPQEIQKEIQKNTQLSGESLESISEKLSPIVGKLAQDILKQLSKKNDLYEKFVQKASDSQVEEIKKLNIKGIYIDSFSARYYSFGKFAAHLLGYVSVANDKEAEKYGNAQIGRYGVESQFNSLLAGEVGNVKSDKIISPKDGQNLILTIDSNIQFQSENILKGLLEKWGAKSGTIIVQEPFSGKILAMASAPDFDPNNFSDFNIGNFINPAVELIYEPGSVFKIITMSAGIDSGKITPDTTYVDNGFVTLNRKTIRNWDHKSYGKQTMTNVIERSLNTGSVFAESKIGHDIFKNYLNDFGFNELTGINLPGEINGKLNNLKNGRDIDFATASFGQGVAITPISLINAFSAVANGGILMKPIILADEKPEPKRRVISEDTSKKIVEMMVSAVKKNVIADIPNYKVAGKTGTAYIPNFQKGGYTDDVIHTYMGFAPASHPNFVILIKLEKPNVPLAGQTVLPAFRELSQFILNYYNVAPDNLAVSQ